MIPALSTNTVPASGVQSRTVDTDSDKADPPVTTLPPRRHNFLGLSIRIAVDFPAPLPNRLEGGIVNGPRVEPYPKQTAVIMVDMLNDFCTAEGVMVVPKAVQLYNSLNTLTSRAREAGSPVVWACDSHQDGDREFDIRPPHCLAGTWGAQIVDELDQALDDRYVLKRRFSAFFATDLDLLLREQGIATVIVVGVMTNICVRATVHDAFFHGYQVIVPSDCVATVSSREQESTLDDIRTCFGSVSTLDELPVLGLSSTC